MIARAQPAEVSLARSRSGREVVAYAAVFGTPYRVKDQYGEYDEVIDPRAFDEVIRSGEANRAIYVYNHGFGLHGEPLAELQVPLGRPLEIRADGKGLLTRAEVHRTPLGDQILEAIKDGSIASYSFRGPALRSSPPGKRFRPGPDGRRTLVTRHALGLVDFGPTPLAVNEGSKILAVRSELAARARTMRDPDEPYGDVEYADPGYQDDGRKRYPIDTEEHVRAAWSYINQRDNADRYTPEQLRRIKERIRRAGEKFGITFREDSMRSRIAVSSPLADDEIRRFAAQFGRIFDVAAAEPELLRSLAASLGWRSPDTLDSIERSLRGIALSTTSERYREIQVQRQIVRARLAEIAAMDAPDTGDEDEDEEIIAERTAEVDELIDLDDELAEEEAALLDGDMSEVDDEDEGEDSEAYEYA